MNKTSIALTLLTVFALTTASAADAPKKVQYHAPEGQPGFHHIEVRLSDAARERFPGAIVRVSLGSNPPETALTEIAKIARLRLMDAVTED